MIEIQQGAQPSDTLVQLVRQLADAKRGLQVVEQALKTSQMQLAHAQPVADAAHAYAALWLTSGDWTTIDRARVAILDAHQATTPSQVPSSHVIVERAELEGLRTENAHLGARVRDLSAEVDRLQAIERRAAEYVSNHPCEGDPDEDVCSDEDDLHRALDAS